MNKKSKIFLTGHKGMVGSSIYRRLKYLGYNKIIVASRKRLDLLDQKKTFAYLKRNKPDVVIVAAAKVGGILDNLTFKNKFIYENLQIQNNLIHGSYLANVKNLFLLGSSCIYPKHCKQPMKEKYLLNGPLEESNEAYSIAKIAGIKMCQYYSSNYRVNYKSLMPPNLYGPNDNFNLSQSHFYPALIKKIHYSKIKKKKTLVVWGSGRAKRELMYVDDFSAAAVFFMQKGFKEPFLNIGNGREYSIKWFAKFIMKQLDVKLKIKYDRSKPDGMPNKCLDITLAKKYGWKPNPDYIKGFLETYNHFLNYKSKKKSAKV
tara:strand:- start:4292 stop:5242 length:951 start_codon:yes stop_codon:yes gene_type:complete